ncbi:MAG: hypothetical protein HYY17_09740 [Planctomycetes bacterium]|nr:hypothetical protein [Planctomycetota bacterium]
MAQGRRPAPDVGLPVVGEAPPLLKDRGVHILAALFLLFVGSYAFAAWHYDRIRPPRPKKIHMLVYGDGVFYYSFARSILFDRDLDTTNECRYYWHDESAVEAWRSPTGKLNNYCPIGSSLLFVPFVLLIHLFVWGDGFSFAYPAAAAFGSSLLGWIAILMIYRWFRDLAVAIALWFGSNIAYYMSVEPLTSHSCSLFAVTLFTIYALRSGTGTGAWVTRGILLGLAVLVRPEHIMLAPIALRKKHMASFCTMLAVCTVVMLPQIFVWKSVSGTWISPVAGATTVLPLNVLSIMFSTRHGVFMWHPVYLVGATCAIIICRNRLGLIALLAIFGAILFYGTRTAWWGFHSFGSRYFVGLGFFFAVGLAAGAAWLRRLRWGGTLVWSICAILMLWNGSLMLLYVSRSISQSDAVPLRILLLAPIYAVRLLV